jgi:hypothetical protein
VEIKRITIAERGPVPRAMAKYHRAASRTGYETAAQYHHRYHTPKRFTEAHGNEAGFQKRAGETLPFGSKLFWGSYFGRKLKGAPGRPGTSAPLVWSGVTRDRARVTTITVTTNRGQLRYNVNALSFRGFPQEEFRRILPRELERLGQVFDKAYNKEFNRDLDEGKRFI